MIVRGGGSSAEAESMLDKMIENVLKVERAGVAVVDLVRDSRSAQVVGDELRRDLANLRPGLILIMGTFSAQALLGGEGSIGDVRGEWLDVEWSGGRASARVTHHPEALLALAARGQHGAKRETFTDLQEVAERIS
jgi:uracil-DNA glycosylase family 4